MPHSKRDRDPAVLERSGGTFPLALGGLPSPESIFAIHSASEIVRRTRGGARAEPLNSLVDFQAIANNGQGEPLLPFFDTPDRDARRAILSTGAPIVIIDSNFTETARFCMIARRLDALQAARFLSQSFSCLEPLSRRSSARLVRVDKAKSIEQWIDEVADWIGLQPSGWQSARQQMLADWAAWPTVEAALYALVEFADPQVAAWPPLSSEIETLFDTLSDSYRFGSLDQIFWPADCILEPGDPASPVSGPISLVGPSRCLTFGPFMHLPPGHWTARYRFDVDKRIEGNLMEFDIVNGGDVIASGRGMVDRAGGFGFDCKFDMIEARLPVENRAILAEGSIGGLFKPLGIWLSRDQYAE